MFSTENLNLLVALGTLAAAVFAGISAIIATRSALDATKQLRLNLDSIRAQTFLNIIGYEREIHFSAGMDIIRELDNESYEVLRDEKNQHVRKVVDFLNHIAHLIRQGYVVPEHILLLYTASILDCREKILGEGKWLQGFRRQAGRTYYYQHFECLCKNVEKLWYHEKVEWPATPFPSQKLGQGIR
jgi:hypothetical protein